MQNFSFKNYLTEEFLVHPLYLKYKNLLKINHKTIRYDKRRTIFKISHKKKDEYAIRIIKKSEHHTYMSGYIFVNHKDGLLNILKYVDLREKIIKKNKRIK